MSIKVTRIEEINEFEDTKDIIQKLKISDTKDGEICTYTLEYLISGNAPTYVNSDVMMHTDEGYEVAESATCWDIDSHEILIKANINVYKKPHKGWNNRLIKNVWLAVYDDGRVEHGCM